MKRRFQWIVEYHKLDNGSYLYSRYFDTEVEANTFAKDIEDAKITMIEWFR